MHLHRHFTLGHPGTGLVAVKLLCMRAGRYCLPPAGLRLHRFDAVRGSPHALRFLTCDQGTQQSVHTEQKSRSLKICCCTLYTVSIYVCKPRALHPEAVLDLKCERFDKARQTICAANVAAVNESLHRSRPKFEFRHESTCAANVTLVITNPCLAQWYCACASCSNLQHSTFFRLSEEVIQRPSGTW